MDGEEEEEETHRGLVPPLSIVDMGKGGAREMERKEEEEAGRKVEVLGMRRREMEEEVGREMEEERAFLHIFGFFHFQPNKI